jgi:protease I
MELDGKRIAVLAENLYEDLELWYPVIRMREAGAKATVVGTGTADTCTSKHGLPVTVEATPGKVTATDFDAVIVPGGYAPDLLRRHKPVLKLVRDVFDAGKPVAAICHAGWVLVSAGIVRGKRLTSFSSIRDDMVNAGARWEDSEVVVDGNLITSRKPDDLPAFCKAIIRALTESAAEPGRAPEARRAATKRKGRR